MTKAAKAAKVSRTTVYDHMDRDPEFTKLVDEATRKGICSLEEHAVKRALKGSDVLTMFLLNGNRPDKYRRNPKDNADAGVHVKITPEEADL
jgi:hypothetical protein